MRKFLLPLLVVLAQAISCRAAAPESIVLVISDGTSIELITAARLYSKGAQGRLALEDFPQTALVRTWSRNGIVTDSSAGATAMARGIKADNGVVGMAGSRDTSGPKSLLDIARDHGWSTGVISDDSITGATPCSFIVEQGGRGEDSSIATKIAGHLGSRVDIVMGGGSRWFFDNKDKPLTKPEEIAILEANKKTLQDKNAAAFDSWDAFLEYAKSPDASRPVLATFYRGEFPYHADGTRTLRLKDMTEQTVSLLKARGKPFFLMVEAGLPDKASHQNQAKRAITEVLELDATLDWLRKNLPDTLILVTTDHNTGGIIINGYMPLQTTGDTLLGQNPVSNSSILTFASGPGGQPDANIRKNPVGPSGAYPPGEKKTTDPDYTQPSLIPTGSAMHSGGDVWLLGSGPGSDRVHGFIDNTDIYRIVADAIEAK